MSNDLTKQSMLVFDIGNMDDALRVGEGIPSAHDTDTVYHPFFNGERWICDPDHPCEHFRRYGTPCRHIFIHRLEIPRRLGGVQETSIDAFVELLADPDSLNERYRDILTALYEIGMPSSDREIARRLGFGDPNRVRPRRFELADMTGKYFLRPLLVNTGKRICKVSGKMVYIWDFTEFGRMIVKDILK